MQKPLPVSCQPKPPTMMIAPNPAASYVTVQGDSIKYVYLIDEIGRKLTKNYEINFSTHGSIQIDVSGLSAGLYFLTAVDTKGNLSSKKFLVIRL